MGEDQAGGEREWPAIGVEVRLAARLAAVEEQLKTARESAALQVAATTAQMVWLSERMAVFENRIGAEAAREVAAQISIQVAAHLSALESRLSALEKRLSAFESTASSPSGSGSAAVPAEVVYEHATQLAQDWIDDKSHPGRPSHEAIRAVRIVLMQSNPAAYDDDPPDDVTCLELIAASRGFPHTS